MTDGVLINGGTVCTVLYGYQAGMKVPEGQTLVALPSVTGVKPGMADAVVSNMQITRASDLAAVLVRKGVLTGADLKQSGTVVA